MESEGKDEDSSEASGFLKESVSKTSKGTITGKGGIPEKRPRKQLWLQAALMCGRDFLYAVEVVLVAPIMLQLGMPEDTLSYIWFVSPTFGLLLGPIMGSWSDRCERKWGRRRPFILGFVIGTVIALTLMIFSNDIASSIPMSESSRHSLRLAFGVLGTQTMDFCLDQLETPLRAYTLDCCSPLDQQRAFMLQTLFMGFGGALGFIVDGIDWASVFSSQIPGFQIKVVYAFAITIYLATATMTLFSIKEIQWTKESAGHKKSNARSTKDVGKSVSDSSAIPAIKICGTNSIERKSGVLSKRGRSVDDRSQSGRECCQDSCQIKRNTGSDYTAASTNQNVLLNAESGAPGKETREGSERGFAYASPTIHSLALFPRISMCKSVYLTMSCPEGLNDTVSSLANASSSSMDDEASSSGDDEDDSAKSDQDDIFQSSMPNLSAVKRPEESPATFLEILKNKIFDFSSTQKVSNTGSSVDNESFTPLFSDNAVDGKPIDNDNSSNVAENYDKNKFSSPKCAVSFNIESDKNTNLTDLIENGDVNEGLKELDAQGGDKEKMVGRGGGRKRRKRPAKTEDTDVEGDNNPVSLRKLWWSVITMPRQLRYLCLSLLFSMIGIEVILLWYTNIFGSVVYGGDPAAPENSTELKLYNEGVHMGCWGLTMYGVAMMVFSLLVEKFNILSRISLRVLYSGGQLLAAASFTVMFLFPTKYVILALSWTIGITVSTSLTIPYVLVGKYHQDKEYVKKSPGSTKRGFGTDCAILSCQMYAGNLLYAAISGPIIGAYGNVRIMIIVASICHAVAFVFCVFTVFYPGERNFKFCSRKPRTSNAKNLNIC